MHIPKEAITTMVPDILNRDSLATKRTYLPTQLDEGLGKYSHGHKDRSEFNVGNQILQVSYRIRLLQLPISFQLSAILSVIKI